MIHMQPDGNQVKRSTSPTRQGLKRNHLKQETKEWKGHLKTVHIFFHDTHKNGFRDQYERLQHVLIAQQGIHTFRGAWGRQQTMHADRR